MGWIVGLVFLGTFAAVALLLAAGSLAPSRAAKAVQARLESVLAIDSPQMREAVVNLRKDLRLSGIAWLNRSLQKFEVAPYLRRLLEQASVNWSVQRLLFSCAIFFGAGFYAADLRLRSFWAALVAAIVIGGAPLAYVRFKRNQRFAQFEHGLPEALDLMVSGLRAGQSLIAAMSLVGRECADPVGVEFRMCFDEQNYGLELKTAIDNLLERMPLQDLRIVATAILIQKESGGNLAEVLDKTGYVIRERFRLKRQVKVHTAQGRLTGWILTLLPVVLGVGLYSVNPASMSILWTREIGIKLLWTSAGMTILGGLIIHKIVDMDV